jgi:hypothetical protein
MASITPINGAPVLPGFLGLGGTIANVDFPVGRLATRGSGNSMGDVQLVQLLLNRAIDFLAANNKPPLTDNGGRAIGSLDVDGLCGNRTMEAIVAYQHLTKQRYREQEKTNPKPGGVTSVYEDGVVNKSSPTGISSMSRTMYTIVWLNAEFTGDTDRAFTADDAGDLEPLRSQLAASSTPAVDPSS